MNKINFQNLPSTATPLNAENLNQMQSNIENAINSLKPTELFYSSSGETSTIILNDNVTNYDILTITGQSTDGHQCSTTIYKPAINNKFVLVAPKISSGTTIYNKQAVFVISELNKIIMLENYELQGNTTAVSGPYIKITAVLGYKA